MSDADRELEPCRYCETETTQRVNGIPYCSIRCIGRRRGEKNRETLRCPFPDCEWETSYLPDNGLSRAVAYHEADEHRDDHRSDDG